MSFEILRFGCQAAVKVNDWNLDLSQWAAPAVFGEEDFGGGAAKTLEFLLGEGLAGADCILEWNKENHFKEPDLRMAKAFAWLMNREKK